MWLKQFLYITFADHFQQHKDREERIKQLKEKQNEGKLSMILYDRLDTHTQIVSMPCLINFLSSLRAKK